MWKAFCSWMLYRVWGWRTEITELHPDKFIICLAPHTSNIDFIIGQLYSGASGIKSNFLMKREWFRGPLGIFFRHIGGIPVWRSKHTSMTDNLAETAKKLKSFHLCITPEGTRSPNPEWKKGFYFIAMKADMPILLYSLDFEKKLIKYTKTIYPNGDIDTQMKEIKTYFKDCKGRNPKNFVLGEI